MSLRERLSDPRIIVAVGAHDGLTATLAERAGFEAVYAGGYSVAAHNHGLPDIGLVGLAEVAASLMRMTAVATVPVVVDADTGYGSEPGVKRSVIELERAGAAAVQIEDQVFPKRCGHMEGKKVIPRDEMVLKLRAALGAVARALAQLKKDGTVEGFVKDMQTREQLYTLVGYTPGKPWDSPAR
jgi:2-methylisocitrate lyase-like PEP mutase family enzyme